MDFASIGLSAVLSALLFVALEFTVILPLFRKIVTRAVNDEVQGQLIPSVTKFVDDKVTGLTETLTKSIFVKIRGMLGGSKKGTNAIFERLMQGENLEDIEDEYEPTTIDKVYDIIETVRPFLPNPSSRKEAAAAKEEAATEGIMEH
jgi:hypothetical protein